MAGVVDDGPDRASQSRSTPFGRCEIYQHNGRVTWELGVDAASWALLALGAAIVGFSKAAIGGAVTVSVAIFALVLPTRESTGVLLVLLMLGDLIAIWTYRKHGDFPLLARLVVPVVVGVAVGAVFLAYAPTAWLKPAIGGIIVGMSLIELVQRLRRMRRMRRERQARRTTRHDGGYQAGRDVVDADTAETGDTVDAVESPPATPAPSPDHRGGRGKVFGTMAGFTTMVANAGGPVMALYLLRADLGVIKFVGTFAWFFFTVNLIKLPVSLTLGLVQPSRMPLILSLIPAIVAGAVIGRMLIVHIPRPVFEWTILLVALASGTYLMFA